MDKHLYDIIFRELRLSFPNTPDDILEGVTESLVYVIPQSLKSTDEKETK